MYAVTIGSRDTDCLINTFKPGQHITVYYNPRNPNESVLIQGSSFVGILPLLGIVLVIAVIGITIEVWGRSR